MKNQFEIINDKIAEHYRQIELLKAEYQTRSAGLGSKKPVITTRLIIVSREVE